MSVVKSQRQEGRLAFMREARNLAAYTLQICGNEKYFPKRSRWQLAKYITDEALALLGHVRKGNAVHVKTAGDYAQRRREQQEAMASAEALAAYIDLAFERLQLPGEKVEYWAGLVDGTEKRLNGWIASDFDRYGDLN